MNLFLRRAMERIDREHEERVVTLRGSALPKHDRGDSGLEARAEIKEQREMRDERIRETSRRNPELSAWEIAKRCETSHPTVLRVLRAAGLK